jgi:hypothetical protein
MTTLGGDLIRLLAHAGLSTAGNVGTQLLANYLQPGMQTQTAAGKEFINMMGTNPNEATAEALKSYGVDWPRGPVQNAAGTEVTSPEGVKLTAPRSTPLNELAPGINPTTALIRGAPSSDQVKADIINSLPLEAKQGILTRDPQMITELAKKQMDLQARAEDHKLSWEERRTAAAQAQGIQLQIAGLHTDVTKMLGQQNHEDRMARTRETANRNKLFAGILSGKTRDADEAKAHTLIGNAARDYEAVPISNTDAKVAAANRHNGLLETYGTKYPDIGMAYQRLEPITPEGKFWNSGNQGKPMPGLKSPTSPAAVQETVLGNDGKTYNVIIKDGRKFVDPKSGR